MKDAKDKLDQNARKERADRLSATKNVTLGPMQSPSTLRKSRRHGAITDHFSNLRSYETWVKDVRDAWKK
ncbi:MAG TPA: hypothetical protein VKG63_19190 [Steroidobacteraceae bacterium]|nr:hypothetical protein [Steroidobacteraceae bacterium]